MAKKIREGAAGCGARAEGYEQIEAEHGGRQHDGQRADGLDKDLRAAAGKRQPAGQRHGDYEQDHSRNQREAKRQ